MSDPEKALGRSIGMPLMGELTVGEPDDVKELTDGSKLTLAGLEFGVSHAPGHTKGSVTFGMPEAAEIPPVFFSGDLVTVGQGPQLGEHLGLGARTRQIQRVGVLDHIRHGGAGELVQRAVPTCASIFGPRLQVGPDVALLEGDSLFEVGERNAMGGHCGGLLV
ncbi:hypothetical protein SBADM41S_05023 [Streptomyces badius]